MPSRKKKNKKPKFKTSTLLISLVVLGGLAYSLYRVIPSVLSPISVFQIDVAPLSEGETTLSGQFLKDAPAGEPGTYLLALPDGRPIQLDITENLDFILGSSVTVIGTLTLPTEEGGVPFLVVSSIETN